MQNQEIIDKIAKLLALATSPNEYEASQAAAKAQELLMVHNLSLGDIKGEGNKLQDTTGETEIDSYGKKIHWKGFLAQAIANTNFCQMYWNIRDGQTRTTILGKAHNVAITKSLYDYLTNAIERLATEGVKEQKRNYQEYLRQIEGTGINAYPEPNWRTWKSSFISGCSRRLCDRLKEQKRQMERDGISAEPGQNVNSGLACRQAYERESAAIELWKRKNNLCIRSSTYRSKAQIASDGYAAGQRAGDGIGLNRQVTAGETCSGRLLT